MHGLLLQDWQWSSEVGGSKDTGLYLAGTSILVLVRRFCGKVREPLEACTALSLKDLPQSMLQGGLEVV